MNTPVTPGVTIREIASFPPSVAEVATAIPVFVGHVARDTAPDGTDNEGVSKRITSLLEFEQIYGIPPAQDLSVTATKREGPNGALLGVDVAFNAAPEAVPAAPRLLYHCMQMFYANGGGACWVHAIASAGADVAAFRDAFTAVESVDEVTLLVFPDALALSVSDYGDVVEAALQSCNRTQDRFTIADVPDAHPAAATPVTTNGLVTSNFRDEVGLVSEDFLKYGAAYMPYLNTSVGILVDESRVTVDSTLSQTLSFDADGVQTSAAALLTADATLDSTALRGDPGVAPGELAVVDAIRARLRQTRVTLPPSAPVAGIYARIDRTRGVHKAPANAGILSVVEPALPINNALNGELNVDATSGKSVNAIRNFTGRGTLVWGARTLAGNSNDNRYINVRRFLNFAEESIGKAISPFVFAPNDANTWVRVRTMIENFLAVQWRNGALVGPKPEQAFSVRVGLNQTMTFDDILNGRMIVRVGLAISRPAEFIILEFQQIQQQA
jgi:phage tail sheath protein FI